VESRQQYHSNGNHPRLNVRNAGRQAGTVSGWGGELMTHASSPGQAITYQIGKLQNIRFLADARLDQKKKFSLRAQIDCKVFDAPCGLALL
jgi:hypothetical protein